MFSVGDRIVYPMHGAGIIEAIEEQKILGEQKAYYILRLPGNALDVMIPVDSTDVIGIRFVVGKEEIANAVATLRAESTPMDSNWNRRHRENMELLKKGDIITVASVVRNLMRADRVKKLSAGEKRMLSSATTILASEFVLAGDMTLESANKLIVESV